MTGCRMNVHFIGGRTAQKRTGRAARCGPASRCAGEYERSRSGYRRDGLMAPVRPGRRPARRPFPKAAPRAPVAVAANVPVRTDPAPSPS